MIARIVDDRPATGRRPRTRARLRRTAWLLVVGLLAGFLALGGTSGAQPAMAVSVCQPDANGMEPGDYSGGLAAFMPKVGGPSNREYNENWVDTQITAYEWFGSSGANWSYWVGHSPPDLVDVANGAFDDPCIAIGLTVKNFIANAVFDLSKTISTIGITIYAWAASNDLIDTLGEPVSCLVVGCNGSQGLADLLFFNYLVVVVLASALWMAWTGLVKKRTTETAQGMVWVIGSAAASVVFLSNPIGIVSWADNVTGNVSDYVIEQVGEVDNVSGAGAEETQQLCTLGDGANDRGVRMASCQLWKTLIITPWAQGQFGALSTVPTNTDREVAFAGKHLKDLIWLQLDGQTLNHDQSIKTGGDKSAEVVEDGEIWNDVKNQITCSDPGFFGTLLGDGDCGDEPDNPEYFMTWSGNNGGDRIAIAMVALMASVTVGGMLIVLGFTFLVAVLSVLLLTVAAPVVLLIGAHPGAGRPLALKWVELFLGQFIKQIGLSAALLVVATLMAAVQQADGLSWIGQLLVMFAIAMAALFLRKPLMQSLNVVKINGAAPMDFSSMDRGAKKFAAGGTGGVAGAIGGVRSGGGLMGAVTGGVKGATRGGRTGDVTRAATTGYAAGTQSGARVQARSAKATERAEARREKFKAGLAGALTPRGEVDTLIEIPEDARPEVPANRIRENTPRPEVPTNRQTGTPEVPPNAQPGLPSVPPNRIPDGARPGVPSGTPVAPGSPGTPRIPDVHTLMGPRAQGGLPEVPPNRQGRLPDVRPLDPLPPISPGNFTSAKKPPPPAAGAIAVSSSHSAAPPPRPSLPKAPAPGKPPAPPGAARAQVPPISELIKPATERRRDQ